MPYDKTGIYLQFKKVLHEQDAGVLAKNAGERKFSNCTFACSFEYFLSYNKMHQDFELPSISTLTRLTSLTKRNDDINTTSPECLLICQVEKTVPLFLPTNFM